MTGLFENLPEFPPALPDDELRLLADLPAWPTRQEIPDDQHAPARRLERRGLVKIERSLADPSGVVRTWYVGKLAAASVRLDDCQRCRAAPAIWEIGATGEYICDDCFSRSHITPNDNL